MCSENEEVELQVRNRCCPIREDLVGNQLQVVPGVVHNVSSERNGKFGTIVESAYRLTRENAASPRKITGEPKLPGKFRLLIAVALCLLQLLDFLDDRPEEVFHALDGLVEALVVALRGALFGVALVLAGGEIRAGVHEDLRELQQGLLDEPLTGVYKESI